MFVRDMGDGLLGDLQTLHQDRIVNRIGARTEERAQSGKVEAPRSPGSAGTARAPRSAGATRSTSPAQNRHFALPRLGYSGRAQRLGRALPEIVVHCRMVSALAGDCEARLAGQQV